MAQRRRRIVVLCLESDFVLPEVTAAAQRLLGELRGAGLRDDVGVGLLSMLGFDSTCEHMQARAGGRGAGCTCSCPRWTVWFAAPARF